MWNQLFTVRVKSSLATLFTLPTKLNRLSPIDFPNKNSSLSKYVTNQCGEWGTADPTFERWLLSQSKWALVSFHKMQEAEPIDNPVLSSMLTAYNNQLTGERDFSDLVILGSIDWTGKLCKIREKWYDLVFRTALLISSWQIRDSCRDVCEICLPA